MIFEMHDGSSICWSLKHKVSFPDNISSSDLKAATGVVVCPP
jgi:hypothetical protein